MNILYLVPFWPHLYTPFLFREMDWMRRRGHRVAVASMRRWHDGQVNVERFGLQSVPVIQLRREYLNDRTLLGDLGSLGLRGWLAGPKLRPMVRQYGLRHGLHHWATLAHLVRFARAHDIEVVDAHWASEAADMARLLKQAVGIPYAVTLHGGDTYRAPSPHLAAILRSASAVLPVSQYLADVLTHRQPTIDGSIIPDCNLGPDRLRVRHHGLPQESLASTPVSQQSPQVVFCAVGRLDPEKRQMDLLQAAGPLASRYPALRLRIIGGGQLEPSLRTAAAELGLQDRLEITGSLPWEQVIQLMRQSHVLVQPSAVEGFGLTVVEAAGQGLPVLASRTGAHGAVVQDGINGYLFAPGDVAALREHMIRLLDDGSLRQRMGTAGLERIREHFLFERLMPTVEAILQSVRQGQPLPRVRD